MVPQTSQILQCLSLHEESMFGMKLVCLLLYSCHCSSTIYFNYKKLCAVQLPNLTLNLYLLQSRKGFI